MENFSDWILTWVGGGNEDTKNDEEQQAPAPLEQPPCPHCEGTGKREVRKNLAHASLRASYALNPTEHKYWFNFWPSMMEIKKISSEYSFENVLN